MTRAGAAIALGALLVVSGCASGPDLLARDHVVRKGENLYQISRRYGTTVDAIARANRMSDPTKLRVGQRLVIPPRTRSSARTARSAPPSTNGNGTSYGRSVPKLIWPLSGAGGVTSSYGIRNGAHHDGIDVPARPGTKIRAAASGRVIHADDDLAGYGNLIILKHAGDFSTVYAHNKRNLVRVGQFVEQGQVIAEVGQTGRTTAPHLHFEVRHDGRPRDPLNYLP